MKLTIVGLQSGPNLNGESYTDRLEMLAAQFDHAIHDNPGTDLVVFPELMTTPYFCPIDDQSFFELAEPLLGETFTFFSQKARDSGVYVVITIFEKYADDQNTSYYNTAIMISDAGEYIGSYRKTHIPKLALPTLTTDETRYFKRGTEFPVFDVKGYKVGILICFDRSFPEAARALALQGAELIIIPTAAGGEERKAAWLSECQARARENGLYVVGVNKAGDETLKAEGRELTSRFFGLSCAFDPSGNAVQPHLDSEPWKHIILEIDGKKVEEQRNRLNFLDFLQGDLYHSYSSEVQKVRKYEIKRETVPLFGPKGVVTID
ncbi:MULTISPECIES: carbon-nitrogen hydrolase family protein [Bacillus]|nr:MULTISPECIES: carbon-nitrogen hydrolase family protein [Bacillus]